MPIGNGLGETFDDYFDMHQQIHFPNAKLKIPPKSFSDEGGPVYPPNTKEGDDLNMWNTDQRPPEFMNVSDKKEEKSIDQELKDLDESYKKLYPESHAFRQQSGEDFIKNIEKNPSLFAPLREEMEGPMKPYSDKAKQLTRKLYDLYKKGDLDAIEVVHGYEDQIHGRGYADDEEGRALRNRYRTMFGSKAVINNNTLWDLYTQFYSGTMRSEVENPELTDEQRKTLEEAASFDQEGRPTIRISPELQKKLFGIK